MMSFASDPHVASIAHAPMTVLGSAVIAVLASYVALEYAGRLHAARDRLSKILWTVAGSITLGSGIWAMHFVGMSAPSYSFVASYGQVTTALSWLAAVAVSTVLFAALVRHRLQRWPLAGVATAGGVGATAMHFIGEHALVVLPSPSYRVGWIVAAVVAAASGAAAALVLFHRLRTTGGTRRVRLQLCAALALGGSLTAMHYFAMIATSFADGSICISRDGLEVQGLGNAIGFSSTIVLSLLYLVAMLERRAEQRVQLMHGSLAEVQEELRFVTFNDPVTGLPNRLVFQDRLTHAAARCERSRDGVAILFVGLDAASGLALSGDGVDADLLRRVAARMMVVARGSDTVASIGADQFLVMVEGRDVVTTATLYAERLASALREPGIVSDGTGVAASIGIAIHPQDGGADALVKNANMAFLAAQADGGDTYRFFERAMDEQMRAHASLLADLRLAVARDELELHYQPKVYAKTGTIAGVEALVRWRHPVRGLVSPAAFIPIAEEYGLIDELGHWVMREAIRQMQRWAVEGLRVRTAVNVSVRQLRRPGLADEITGTLRTYGVEPSLLTCEVTESGAMHDQAASLAIFEALTDAGIQISIDDFGTGYSSLSHLSRLPVRQLKIDRSFVLDLDRRDNARPIVAAIVQLARTLGLEVVAEGVETDRQRVTLLDLGCHKLQGYLFARPMPASELTPLLRDRLAHSPLFNASLVTAD